MNRYTNRRRGSCLSRIVNVLTALLLLVVFVVVGGTAYLAFLSDRQISLAGVADLLLPDEATPTVAAVAILPSATPTPTVLSLRPTWTPLPPEPSVTPRPTNTKAPTLTPSPIPTFPSRTPTSTPTATPTHTPTATPLGPTATPLPTRSAFLFTKTDTSPFYLQNFANNAGCNWSGIAGEVLNLERNPVPVGSYRVHIWGDSLGDKYVVAGSAPAYSPSGWELFLFDAPLEREYNIQLESENGTPVSEVYRVQTRAACDENLLRIDFVQNH